jgi:parallel beta-helix repeat protein
VFVNNTVIKSYYGINTYGAIDNLIENNIFASNVVAACRSGTLSAGNYYNCYYSNMTNFLGYPSTYGNWDLSNRNGT